MNQTSASSRLVDVSEAADRLGLSTLTLYKWISATGESGTSGSGAPSASLKTKSGASWT